MAKKPINLLAGLDVGTTEVRCLIGAQPALQDEESSPKILGLGCAKNTGMRRGVVSNYNEVFASVETAIKQAELHAGCTIDSLVININGGHVKAFSQTAEVAIANSDLLVTERDCYSVTRKVRELTLAPNRSVIDSFTNTYWVDQIKNLEHPINIKGSVLGMEALVLTGDSIYLDMLRRICNELDVQINSFTVSSLAAYQATYDKKISDSGVAVIDIGHSTTNVILVKDGKIENIVVLPVGGFNVTKDIAVVLQVDLETAEFLKLHHAQINYQARGRKTIEFNKQAINFSPQQLSEVVTARLEEICDFIENLLRKKGLYQQLPGGIILAGGTSKIAGLSDLFKEKLETHAQIAQVRNFSGLTEIIQEKHEYLTVAGILAVDFLLQNQPATHVAGDAPWTQKALDFFGDLLKFRQRPSRQSLSSSSAEDKKDNT
ncbi:MAG: cell division protein FtsA [Candidatus Saccharibacteria bacterium]|nr:cell division protein FtsA [Candidatus Saccharibacteria bacterium]